MTVFTPPSEVYGARAGDHFIAETTLIVKQCPTCGITYAMPKRLDDSAREHNRTSDPVDYWRFCCPLGHTLSYPGLNSEQQLKQDLQEARDRAGRLAHDLEQTEARRVAQKAATTRARKRHAAGVCPACKRTFQNVQRHMTSQHPDYDPEKGSHQGS